MTDASEIAIWDDNGEWVELTNTQAARLLIEGKIYYCEADSEETPACHAEAVYHVHDPFTLDEIKAELKGN